MSLSFLRAQALLLPVDPRFHICATDEEHDADGRIIKFKEPLIFPDNKALLVTPERCPEIAHCTTALVLGDVVEDLRVTRALKLDTVLSVGFDNYNKESEAAAMRENYDIVVKNDGSLELVIELIKYIVSGTIPQRIPLLAQHLPK